MRRHILFALIAATLCAGDVYAQAGPLEQGRNARRAGQVDEAERHFRLALREDPQNYLALYNMGLVYGDRAARAPAGAARLRHYRTSAEWLERAVRAPGRASAGEHAVTIYNTLGLAYLALGEHARAARYLTLGLRARRRLSDESRGRLYANVGYYFALEGDATRACWFFREGGRLESRFARENFERLDQAGIC